MSVTRSSDPLVQHREGPDLDALVEEIAAEHPVPVRFLDVDRVRRGGVLGFFAKEQYALSYQVAAEPDAGATAPTAPPPPRPTSRPEPVDLDDLVGSADAADVGPAAIGPRRFADVPPVTGTPGRADTRFADLLMTLASESAAAASEAAPPAAHRGENSGRHHADPSSFEPLHSARPSGQARPLHSASEPRHVVADVPAAAPVPADPVTPPPAIATHRAPAVPRADPVRTATLHLVTSPPVAAVASTPVPATVQSPGVAPAASRALAGLGVPDGWGTNDAENTVRLADITAAVLALPAAPPLPTAAGAVVVLLTNGRGTSGPTVQLLSSDLRGGHVAVRDRAEAVRAVAALRAADAPGLLIVDSPPASMPAATIAALQPELVVLAVEATGKTTDHCHRLDAASAAGLRVDALAVERAAETSSPATVWELDVPVLSVDGRRSGVGAWLEVLLAAQVVQGG